MELEDLIRESWQNTSYAKMTPREIVDDLLSSPELQRTAKLEQLWGFAQVRIPGAVAALLEWLRSLPEGPPTSKVDSYRGVLLLFGEIFGEKQLLDFLVSELHRIRPNNRTRYWLRALLRTLEGLSCEEAGEALLTMAHDTKHFSLRWRRHFLEAHDRWQYTRWYEHRHTDL